MKASFFRFNLLFVLVGVISTASAEYMDRPAGIKVGQRMTLRPYVALSFTYDSNVDSQRESTAGSSWVVNPGMGLEYRGENWQVAGSVWYQYHAYNNYSSQLDQSSYGEKLSFSWANSRPDSTRQPTRCGPLHIFRGKRKIIARLNLKIALEGSY
jgi:hypothetical protein